MPDMHAIQRPCAAENTTRNLVRINAEFWKRGGPPGRPCGPSRL